MQSVWQVKSHLKPDTKNRLQAIIDALLKNRGLSSKQDQEVFFQKAKLEDISIEKLAIPKTQITKVLKRLEKALKNKEKIVIYGDYDADGITATAIMWETLHALGFKVMPFLPHREEQGYGLKPDGIDAVIKQLGKPDLLMTVDNGIVAFEGVQHANKLGIDVIITDHHEAHHTSHKYPENKVKTKATYPDALAVIHSIQTAGAGVSFLLAKKIWQHFKGQKPNFLENLLELATIGIIADIIPLLGINRQIVSLGLKLLAKTSRPGLKALMTEAQIDLNADLNTYHVGFIIAPRLNATGRLEHSLNSLRLLCTKDQGKAIRLALDLGSINKTRQGLTKQSLDNALKLFTDKEHLEKLLITDSTTYNPGVIGLIAGKLTEQFHRPAIVMATLDGVAKGSVRSVPGVDIIALLREFEEEFLELGGHPMAAGFSLETDKIATVSHKLQARAEEIIDGKLLVPTLEADLELDFNDLSFDLYHDLEKFAPFGLANSRPVFITRNVQVESLRPVGQQAKHLKLTLHQQSLNSNIDAIYFSAGDWLSNLQQGDTTDIAYQLDLNTWNGNQSLQLIIKDIKKVD
ncbi:single-stranded-DNA-specific exonuclease RecJ [Candidatus Beckwithbacteria bacterium]|nr:single-stranded-DNA-specific exonuclease RecJ [Candidatus Beckwithbacteria bacterium]